MRKILIPLGLIALALWGLLVSRREPSPAWTSSSPEAVAEFEAALEAFNRLYLPEAYEHLDAAVTLDPDFAVAHAFRAQYLHGEEREAALERLQGAGLDRVTPREAFLVRHRIARLEGRPADARRVLSEFTAEYPEDPFGLETRGQLAWADQEWEEAERSYRQLIEQHPNWVRAQNYLGYIEMARGNFATAEDHFRTYMFIAPDQANPYDSMGELLILLGREREAEEVLRKALEIRPDFCASYDHLADLRVLQGRTGEIEALAAEASDHCQHWEGHCAGLRCRGLIWTAYNAGDIERGWDLLQGECAEARSADIDLLKYRIALLAGREDLADAAEAALRKRIDGDKRVPKPYADFLSAALAHLEGVRYATEGDFDDAVDAFQSSDAHLPYWALESGTGPFKLVNRLYLVRALELAGRGEEAEAMLSEVAEVNPTLATRYDEFPFRLATDPL